MPPPGIDLGQPCNACLSAAESAAGAGCMAGYQCVALVGSAPSCHGTCAECTRGQTCPYGTGNPDALVAPTLCPAGYSCPEPTRKEGAAAAGLDPSTSGPSP